ncbi:Hypothetical protein NTJ_04913 [Nesidiocoris tenuis]|uniref:Uncharacterized protein n=1 Tax=Nesidiocoris tenuis TaxID=355587 RepID=A0ABN7AIL0_9HEMI|nr:Hypothetical protein NTJ_04913 [Nesidiocoris tenuis]
MKRPLADITPDHLGDEGLIGRRQRDKGCDEIATFPGEVRDAGRNVRLLRRSTGSVWCSATAELRTTGFQGVRRRREPPAHGARVRLSQTPRPDADQLRPTSTRTCPKAQ